MITQFGEGYWLGAIGAFDRGQELGYSTLLNGGGSEGGGHKRVKSSWQRERKARKRARPALLVTTSNESKMCCF